MSSISLVGIGYRDVSKLLGKTLKVRVSCFNTPSSFYVQLVDEDTEYNTLEISLNNFYDSRPTLRRKKSIFKIKETRNLDLHSRLKMNNLKTNMMVAVSVNGKWTRSLVTRDPSFCKMLDTGLTFKLLKSHEEDGIFELEHCFLKLPPRVILCGLGNVIPISPIGHCWSKIACSVFQHAIKNRRLRGYFIKAGLYPNTCYLFLSSIGKEGEVVHVNTMLLAFDTAIPDLAATHHPIWELDTPY